MKSSLLIFIVILLSTSCGDVVRLKVKVVDETGKPVDTASVRLGMPMFGEGKPEQIYDRTTDLKGFVEITGSGGMAYIILASKDGYYGNRPKIESTDRHQIATTGSGENVSIVLRRVRNPQRSIFKIANGIVIPHANTWCGYDMVRGDWVAPDGSGMISDIEVRVTGKGTSVYDMENTYEIRFPGENDGIQECTELHTDSYYEMPYTAPDNGYDRTHAWNKFGAEKHNLRIGFSGHPYIFRIRTVSDGNGGLSGMCGYFTEDPILYGWKEGMFKAAFKYLLCPDRGESLEFAIDKRQRL